MESLIDIFRNSLSGLYSETTIDELVLELQALSSSIKQKERATTFSPSDAVLITYADSVCNAAVQTPLSALRSLICGQSWQRLFPVVHLLPFYPWDTDRGFSVCDFYKVAEENGTWADIRNLAKDVRLMFDFVANHASILNPLVQASLIVRHLTPEHGSYADLKKYENFVLAFSAEDRPSEEELAALSRPRAAPVLTDYYVEQREDESLVAKLGIAGSSTTILGQGCVWTTFSRGVDAVGVERTKQVDLNFKNPQVFLEALRIVLFYAEQQASWIRLDAIGYLWKSLGSSSLHEPETHKLLAAFKAALTFCVPELISVAEVNEPQEKVLAYLGTPDKPEADLVYQFTHFPLAVHALFRGDASWYRTWLASSEAAKGKQFITVLGSHDGIGLKPVRGILPEEEIEALSEYLVETRGGLPNYAKLPGGKKIVYEICATAWELVNGRSQEPFPVQLARYRVIIALGLFARGVPAFYFQGVFGANNYQPAEGLDENRTVNRERFELSVLESLLADSDTQQYQVLSVLDELLTKRQQSKAFHSEESNLQVLSNVDSRIVAAIRSCQDESICMLVNVSEQEVEVVLTEFVSCGLIEIFSGNKLTAAADGLHLTLPPYGVYWLS